MLATVVWIGGFCGIALFILPARQVGHEDADYARRLERLRGRIDAAGWMSVAVLLASGLVQMSANPHYEGLLSVGNRWSGAILLKHALYFAMVGANAYLTWGVNPGLQRGSLLQSRGVESPEWGLYLRRERGLVYFNITLGALVLGLTAIARAS